MESKRQEDQQQGTQEGFESMSLSALQQKVYLQVCPDKGPASRVVEVALHEEVEEVGSVAADGAQLGVAALEDFIAEGGTHVGTAVEEGAGELEERGGRGGGGLQSYRLIHTV